MESEAGKSRPMTDRRNGRTPSLSFGTARTHQSIQRSDLSRDNLQTSNSSDPAFFRPSTPVNDVDMVYEKDATLLEPYEGSCGRPHAEQATNYKSPATEDRWLLNTRAHGLPLDTIVERNSRSTLATRKSAPLLAGIFAVRSNSSPENISERPRSEGNGGVRLTKSLDNIDLLGSIQTFHRDHNLDNSGEDGTTAARRHQDCLSSDSISSVVPSVSPQASPKSRHVVSLNPRRRTSNGIREIFQRLWTSAQAKGTNAFIDRQDFKINPQRSKPVFPIHDEKANVELPGETSSVPVLSVVSTSSCMDPAFCPPATENIEPSTDDCFVTPLIAAAQQLDTNPLETWLLETEASANVPSSAAKYMRKLLYGSPGEPRLVEDTESRSSTPSPLQCSAKKVPVGLEDSVARNPPPLLTVRNGLPPSSPLSGRSVCFGNSPPRQINATSDLASLNRQIRASEEQERCLPWDPSLYQAEADCSIRADKHTCDICSTSLCLSPHSSFSSATGWSYPLWYDSPSRKTSRHCRPRIDLASPLFDPFQPSPPPSKPATPILAPSPLRPRPRPRSSFLLFPNIPAPSPFIPPPRPWRSFSSMLRLRSSTAHDSRPSTEISCPHGNPMSRPNVYTGRKIKRHWWHTADFAANGPEGCKKCSNQDVKLRLRQYIATTCFGQELPLTEESDDMEPIPAPPSHRYNAHPQSSRVPPVRAHQRLSTIYSENCSEGVGLADMKAPENCPHGSGDASGKCWRCKRANIGEKVGSGLGHSCGVIVDGENDSDMHSRPIEVRAAMRRSLID